MYEKDSLSPPEPETGHSKLSTSSRWLIDRIDLSVLASWLLGFGLVFYLALEGGGYDSIVRGRVGIVIWWIAIVATLAGAMPLRRHGKLPMVALGLFAGFVAWTALSLAWTESEERTVGELSRVITYFGVFVLALLARGPRAARHMVTAVGCAIALAALIALATRLHPDWIPEASQTADFLSGAQSRLSFPINYWNGLAELIAIGLPLLLYVATSAKSHFARAMVGGLLPAVALALFFTFSRTGTGAALAGLVVFMAFTGDRIAKMLALLVAGTGSIVLILSASGKDALESGFTGSVASTQGDDLTILVIAVCLIVATVHGVISWLISTEWRPRWLRLSRRESQGIAAVGLIVLLVSAVAFEIPGQTSERWEQFKTAESPGNNSARLGSAASNGRYQLWSSALDQFESSPATGTGPGTFEYWWARNGDLPTFVRDTHSLYFQTLGELGFPGLLLLLAFLGLTIGGSAYKAISAPNQSRGQIAAALAGCVAFFISAGFDWSWQIPVLPVAFLLLAAVALTAGGSKPGTSLPWVARAAFGVVGLIAIAAIAIPLGSASKVRQSQNQAREGDLPAALDSSRAAVSIQPGASSPRLQEALVLEAGGQLEAAAEAARQATAREPTNWRSWFVLSRIEAERGMVRESIFAYRKTLQLNTRASFLDPG